MLWKHSQSSSWNCCVLGWLIGKTRFEVRSEHSAALLTNFKCQHCERCCRERKRCCHPLQSLGFLGQTASTASLSCSTAPGWHLPTWYGHETVTCGWRWQWPGCLSIHSALKCSSTSCQLWIVVVQRDLGAKDQTLPLPLRYQLAVCHGKPSQNLNGFPIFGSPKRNYYYSWYSGSEWLGLQFTKLSVNAAYFNDEHVWMNSHHSSSCWTPRCSYPSALYYVAFHARKQMFLSL